VQITAKAQGRGRRRDGRKDRVVDEAIFPCVRVEPRACLRARDFNSRRAFRHEGETE